MVLSSNNHDLFGSNVQTLRQTSNYTNSYNSQSFGSSTLLQQQQQGFHNGMSVQNEIKFKKLAFFEVINEVTKPVVLQRKFKPNIF
jgi:hypothetical protein